MPQLSPSRAAERRDNRYADLLFSLSLIDEIVDRVLTRPDYNPLVQPWILAIVRAFPADSEIRLQWIELARQFAPAARLVDVLPYLLHTRRHMEMQATAAAAAL